MLQTCEAMKAAQHFFQASEVEFDTKTLQPDVSTWANPTNIDVESKIGGLIPSMISNNVRSVWKCVMDISDEYLNAFLGVIFKFKHGCHFQA